MTDYPGGGIPGESLDRLCGALTAPVVNTGHGGGIVVGGKQWSLPQVVAAVGLYSFLSADPRLVLPISEEDYRYLKYPCCCGS